MKISLVRKTELYICFWWKQVQMLHCIEQDNCEGGENQLADGFHGANILKGNCETNSERLSIFIFTSFIFSMPEVQV